MLTKRLSVGGTFYGQRFHYNQQHESSILAFDPHVPAFDGFPPDDILNYVSHSYGVTGFARYRTSEFSRVEVDYNYDVSSYQTLTEETLEYFSYTNYLSRFAYFYGPYGDGYARMVVWRPV